MKSNMGAVLRCTIIMVLSSLFITGVPKYKPSYEELSAILYGSYMNFWVTLNFRISLFFVAGNNAIYYSNTWVFEVLRESVLSKYSENFDKKREGRFHSYLQQLINEEENIYNEISAVQTSGSKSTIFKGKKYYEQPPAQPHDSERFLLGGSSSRKPKFSDLQFVAEELSKLSINFVLRSVDLQNKEPNECRSGIFNCDKMKKIQLKNKIYKVIFHKDELPKKYLGMLNEEVYKMLCEHISGLVNWEIVRRIHNFFFEKTIDVFGEEELNLYKNMILPSYKASENMWRVDKYNFEIFKDILEADDTRIRVLGYIRYFRGV